MNSFSSSAEGRCLLHAPFPSAMTCPSIMSCAANAKAFWFNPMLLCERARTSLIAQRKIRTATEERGVRFRMAIFITAGRNVCLRSRTGKQYSLQRAVAQLGSALEWGSRGRGFKSRRPDFTDRQPVDLCFTFMFCEALRLAFDT